MSREGRAQGLRFWSGDVLVGVALLALLGALVLAAYLPQLGAAKLPVIGGLVATEALLVAVFSMKLRKAPALVLLAAAAGIVFVAILFVMTMTDYPFRQAGERPRTFPDVEPANAPPSVGGNLPDR